MPKRNSGNFVIKNGVLCADNLLYGVVLTFFTVLLSMFGLPIMWVATSFIVLVHLRHDLSQSIPLAFVAILTIFFVSGSATATIPIFTLMILTQLYKKYGSIMLAFESAIVLAIFSVVLVHLFVPDIATWWLERFEPIKLIVLQDKRIDPKQVTEIFASMSKIATGTTAISAIYSALMGLIIGSIWFSLIQKNNKIFNELLNARMGLIVPLISLFGVVAWLLKYNWMVDIIPIIFGSLALYGTYVLVCVSWYLFKKPVWIYIMIILSLFLFTISNVFKVFIVLIAVTDYFANWREIFKKVSVDTK